MRIGLLIYGSLDTLSGGYLYDRKLVEHLRQAGDSVEIVSLPWRSYPAHLADNLSLRLYRRLRDLPVDILLQDELNHPSLTLVNRQLRRHGPRYPLISVVHHLRSSEQHPRRLLPLYRAVERSYLRTVDGFIFNSRTTRQAVGELRGESEEERGERESLAPLGGVIAYPGADHLPAPDEGATEELIRARESDAGPLRILFVGNLIARKGLHHLITALSVCRRLTGCWTLSVMKRSTVRTRLRCAGRSERPDWRTESACTGVCRTRRLAEYRAADLLAVLSYEGFGIVYLEAMAFGLPVLPVFTAAPVKSSIPGVNGFLVEPADADGIAAHLSALAGDRGRLADLGRNARQRFATHPRWADSARRSGRTWKPVYSDHRHVT